MPDKILFINQHAGFIGGLEKYICSVSELLRSRGFSTAALYAERARDFGRFASSFDEIFDFSEIGSLNSAGFALSTLHKISDPALLAAAVAKFSPTAFIHDHDYFCPKGYKYYPYGRINCERPYSRLFCGICASIVPPRHMAGGPLALLQKNFSKCARLNALAKRCPRYVALSEFMKASLVKNGIDKADISVIRPFIYMPRPREKTQNAAVEIVFAGQQVMSKGVTLLLEAASKMKSRAVIRILGSGPRLEHFRGLSKAMGLCERVFFEGWVDNPDDYFSRADVAVFPSLWQEPFGLSGIEAMSRGIPVAGFGVGGVPEWLKDGENGLLVPERDTDAMAAALDTLAGDPGLRASLGRGARSFVEKNYAPEKFLEDFTKLI